MCKAGDVKYFNLPVGGLVAIDSCLVELVLTLNENGFETCECCCGHGDVGRVFLTDGRVLHIESPNDKSLIYYREKDGSQI